MKALILASRQRYERYMPDNEFVKSAEKIYIPFNQTEDKIIKAAESAGALDAEVIFADAIGRVGRALISRMPNLKLIQSEGVGYNGIDVAAARERGIFVCNNKGVNADSVAEQTILLMLGLLRRVVVFDGRVREGLQIQTKEEMMLGGIRELSECTVGLIGFGDIAKAVALKLKPFGCRVVYFTRHPLSAADEAYYGANYVPLDELLHIADIVSLHLPVTESTVNTVNADFIGKMKNTAYLINTARGELVDNLAVCSALTEGRIAGAGFDCVAPEPTLRDNQLLNLPKSAAEKVIFSPHVGGITERSFVVAHKRIWENAQAVINGKNPQNIVS
jgi:lactate dehydrogenase-like 2-hydroxyacid dehydrogenase